MKAIDTNIIIYAHREECPQHKIAKKILYELSEDSQTWGIPHPCFYEFLRVVTHPKGYTPPTPPKIAWQAVSSLIKSPSLSILRPTEKHWQLLEEIIEETKISGNLMHDAHIATLVLENGFDEIITADEDFRRFSRLKVINPFRTVTSH